MLAPAEVMRDVFAKLASGGRRELGFEKRGDRDWKAWQTRLRAALAERVVVEAESTHEVVAEFVG